MEVNIFTVNSSIEFKNSQNRTMSDIFEVIKSIHNTSAKEMYMKLCHSVMTQDSGNTRIPDLTKKMVKVNLYGKCVEAHIYDKFVKLPNDGYGRTVYLKKSVFLDRYGFC